MNNREYVYGVSGSVLAFAMWGILPVYWKQLAGVSSLEVLANRIIWSFVWMLLLLLFQGKFNYIKEAFINKKTLKYAFLSGVTVTANWGIYIWAVNSGNVVEASLGYYINPLFLIFLGTFLYKERLNRFQISALVFAFAGVAILVFHYGRIPWIAFLLTITFSLYGVVKKNMNAEPVTGLVMETAMMAPFALIFILLFRNLPAANASLLDLRTILLLSGAGIVTSVPLLLFSRSTKVIEFSTIGFIQYLSPTLSLLLGIFLYKEEFSFVHVISFSFIWCGLIFYTISLIANRNKQIKCNNMTKNKKLDNI